MDIDHKRQHIISKTDFCKGFTSFHIQWLIPHTDAENTVFSEPIKTMVNSGKKECSIRWHLFVRINVNNQIEYVFIHLEEPNADIVLPISIFRLVLVNENGEKMLTAEQIRTDSSIFWGGIADGRIDKTANVISHIWLDIPNIVAELPVSSDVSFFEPKPILFLKDITDPTLSALVSDMTNLYSDCLNRTESRFSDVHLVIDNDKGDMNEEDGEVYFDAQTDIDQPKSFFCHRNILASRSSVFRAMFADNQFKEGQQKNIIIIKIKDIDFEAMRVLVEFVYMGIMPDLSKKSNKELFDIVYASDKYDLVALRDWCVSALIYYHRSDKLRMQQLELAERHNLAQLKAVGVQQLSMALKAFGDSGTIPMAVINEAARQNMSRKSIIVKNHSN